MKIFRNRIKVVFCIASIVIFTTACEWSEEYDLLSGQLTGYVSFYGESDNSGTEVIIQGSNRHIKAITDESGKFVIDDLESGTYNIIFNKEGFYQYMIMGYGFVGGAVPASIRTIPLYRELDMEIDSMELTDMGMIYSVRLEVTARVSGKDYNNLRCRCFLGDSPGVSYTDYIESFVSGNYIVSGNDIHTISFDFKVDTFKFPSGSELYMIMYPASGSGQYYTNMENGTKIYSSISKDQPSNVASIIVPEKEKLKR